MAQQLEGVRKDGFALVSKRELLYDLVVWALLFNKLDLAEILLWRSDDVLDVSLVASGIMQYRPSNTPPMIPSNIAPSILPIILLIIPSTIPSNRYLSMYPATLGLGLEEQQAMTQGQVRFESIAESLINEIYITDAQDCIELLRSPMLRFHPETGYHDLAHSTNQSRFLCHSSVSVELESRWAAPLRPNVSIFNIATFLTCLWYACLWYPMYVGR